jgi:GntR family transcriptional regulator, transcriptional repressor for pyruvate dehydrogenase complex
MKTFSVIRQTKTYAEIVDQICARVREGNITAGDKLPSERTLAKELGTGRQCLREALSVLEAVGVLEVKHGLGTFVKEDAFASLTKLCDTEREALNPFEAAEVRRIVEAEAVSLAAKRAHPEDVERMENILERLESNIRTGKYAMEDNRDLHIAFIEGANNAVLLRTAKDLIDRSETLIWQAVKEKSMAVPGRAVKYHNEHKQIIEAIKQGNPRKAAQYMRHHWIHIERDLRNFHISPEQSDN